MKYFRHIGKAWKDYGLMAGLFALAIAVIGGLYWIVLTRGMGKEQYTVWVIQSNESGYKPYGIYGQQLTSSLRKKGIHAKINTFYLNCEQYFEPDYRQWRPGHLFALVHLQFFAARCTHCVWGCPLSQQETAGQICALS